jgi:hypothetical protein
MVKNYTILNKFSLYHLLGDRFLSFNYGRDYRVKMLFNANEFPSRDVLGKDKSVEVYFNKVITLDLNEGIFMNYDPNSFINSGLLEIDFNLKVKEKDKILTSFGISDCATIVGYNIQVCSNVYYSYNGKEFTKSEAETLEELLKKDSLLKRVSENLDLFSSKNCSKIENLINVTNYKE